MRCTSTLATLSSCCELFPVLSAMKTLQEIEQAIEMLSLPERLRLYKDLPRLIARDPEDLDWQSVALENFFQDESPDDEMSGQV